MSEQGAVVVRAAEAETPAVGPSWQEIRDRRDRFDNHYVESPAWTKVRG